MNVQDQSIDPAIPRLYQIFQVAKATLLHIHAFWNQHMLHKTQKWQSKKKGAKPLIAVRNETFGGSSQIL